MVVLAARMALVACSVLESVPSGGDATAGECLGPSIFTGCSTRLTLLHPPPSFWPGFLQLWAMEQWSIGNVHMQWVQLLISMDLDRDQRPANRLRSEPALSRSMKSPQPPFSSLPFSSASSHHISNTAIMASVCLVGATGLVVRYLHFQHIGYRNTG